MKYRVLVRECAEPLVRIISVLIFFFLGWKLYGVIGAYLVSVFSGLFLAFYYLRKIFPQITDKKIIPVSEAGTLLSFSWPLLLVQFFSLVMLWIDTLMLGFFRTPHEVGVFNAAQRTALLGSLIINSFNAIFAPIIADLYNRKKFKELSNNFKIVTKWIFTLGLPVFLVLVFFAKSILNVFGADYAEGASSLIILSIGWIFYTAAGSVGKIIVMTGRQKLHFVNMGSILILDIILNSILIPKYGIIGAAFSTSLSITVLALVELIQVYLILRIHPYRKDFLKPIFAGIVSLLGLFVLNKYTGYKFLNSGLIPLIGVSIGFCCLYALVCYMLRLEEEDKVILRKIKEKIFRGYNS